MTSTKKELTINIDKDYEHAYHTRFDNSSKVISVNGVFDNVSETICDKPGIHQYYGDYISCLRRIRKNYREFLAEFISTAVLVLLSCGLIAQEKFRVDRPYSPLVSSLGSGAAVLISISVSGHISGAHMNPAVTIALCLFDRFPIKKVPKYIFAQFLGAFSGSAILYFMIYPAITHFDGGARKVLGVLSTADIFGTYPPSYVGIGSAILSEVIGTCLLVLVVLSSSHSKNEQFKHMSGVVVSFGITAICLSLGYTSGFAINPARDLGPRLFAAIAGWGFEVFTVRDYYFLVPMFAPIIGGILGGVVYSIFID